MIPRGLKVLMISSDRNILVPRSAVSERMKEYGTLVKELHIIVFATKKHARSLKIENSKLKISDNVWVYPTNSLSRWLYPLDAIRIGKNIKASLITTQDPFESGWAGLKLKKILKIPLEVQLHTDPYSRHFSGFLNWIRRLIMRNVMREADSIRDVANLPIYIDRKRIESEPKFDLHKKYGFKTILLMVTRLSKEKNIGMALEVLKKVRNKFPDTGLIVVGSGSEKFPAQDNVVFVGWQEDVASYYKTADIFIQTSFFEGYGLSLVEAGLSGLPIITTPVGIATELAHERDAYIYPVNRPDLFSTGIIDLIENDQKRDDLRMNIKHTLETKLISKDDYINQLKDNWKLVVSLATIPNKADGKR